MDRDRLKKMGKKSCFFVYKSGDADVEKKNPEINFVKALSAVCAVLLWRNAFLSVFDLEALANQIGRKEIIFAEIAVSFAVFILLIAAFKVRRLRVIAYLVIFAPFISAACARKFPPPWASWMLVFAAVLYGTCCAMEGCKAKQVFRSLVLISAVFGIAAGISVFAGKQIDQIRVGENGFYQETRQKIRENVIGKAEELAEKIKNKKDGKFCRLLLFYCALEISRTLYLNFSSPTVISNSSFTFLPINALPMGDASEILPWRTSASFEPTIEYSTSSSNS